jgi:hypothetical protein
LVRAADGGGKDISRWGQATNRIFLGLTELEGEAEWRGPFFFATLADTQLGALEDNTVGALV